MSKLIYLRTERVNFCLNDTMGTRNILQTTNHQHSKYLEKFNNVKEGKKSGPDEHIATDHQCLNFRDCTCTLIVI